MRSANSLVGAHRDKLVAVGRSLVGARGLLDQLQFVEGADEGVQMRSPAPNVKAGDGKCYYELMLFPDARVTLICYAPQDKKNRTAVPFDLTHQGLGLFVSYLEKALG